MSTPLPITFRASPLPAGFDGTPQALMDAIVARLSIEVPNQLVLFGSGPTLPVTDLGPFMLNGNTLYVWSPVSGSYVPQNFEFKPGLDPKPWRGNATAAQTIVFAAPGSSSVDLIYTEIFDPNSVFSASTFTAPEAGYYHIDAKTAVAATAGTPTDVIVLFYLKKNGFQLPQEQSFGDWDNVYVGRTYNISTNIQLSAGDTVKAAVNVSIGGGTATWTITANDTFISGFKLRNLTF